jgi:hypothetical protein
MEANNSDIWPRQVDSYSEVPFVLKSLLLFSILTVALDFYLNLVGPIEVKEAVLPYTGWSLSTTYSFVVVLLSFFMTGHAKKPFYTRNAIALIFAVGIVFGLANVVYTFGREDYGNPYLVVSQWRPIWTILIPVIWVALLYTPRVSKYCEHYRPLVRW